MGLEMTDRAPSDPRLEEAMDWLLRLREAPDDAPPELMSPARPI